MWVSGSGSAGGLVDRLKLDSGRALPDTTQNLRDRQLGPGGVVRDQPASPVLQLKSVIGCGNAFGFGVRVFPGYRFYSRSSARSENRVARRGTTSGERLVK